MASEHTNSQLTNGDVKKPPEKRNSRLPGTNNKKKEENGRVPQNTNSHPQTKTETEVVNTKVLNGAPSWTALLNNKDLLPGQTVPSNEVTDGDTVIPKANGTVVTSKAGLPSTSGRKSALAVPNSSFDDTNKDADRLSLISRRDSTRLSLDSISRRSVDYRIPDSALAPINTEQEDKPKSLVHTEDSIIRTAIPYLPTGLAVICLVFNILLPGSGTAISGFSILCCGRTRLPTKDDHVIVTLCVNVWVGFAQLFTVPLLLVGWFWSLAWGVKMVILSLEYQKEEKIKRDKDLQTLALSAFGSPGRSILPV